MILWILSAWLAVAAVAESNKVGCVKLYAGMVKPADWRKDATHLNASGALVKTSVEREQYIQTLLRAQQYMWEIKDVPMMYLVPEEGILTKEIARATGLDNDYTIEHFLVGNVPKNGRLPITALAPVSGHFGDDAVAKATKTDKYTFEVKDSKGNITRPVNDAQSLDYLTLSETEIQLEKGGTVEVTYHRTNSGPGGYKQGRTVKIQWDPDNEAKVTWDDERLYGW